MSIFHFHVFEKSGIRLVLHNLYCNIYFRIYHMLINLSLQSKLVHYLVKNNTGYHLMALRFKKPIPLCRFLVDIIS